MTDQPLSLGRIVFYTLDAEDANRANQRRLEAVRREHIAGAQLHVGVPLAKGDTYPAIVVHAYPYDVANLQVFLDGNDTLWVINRAKGEPMTPGTWEWPGRV